ncbi:MAG: 3-deoxy-D-manno-octulosonic acid transferase [Sulfitobacter sp.]
MSRPLGLAAYRALTRRGDASPAIPSAPRPRGELVWFHGAEPGNLMPLLDLAARLCTLRDGTQALVTAPSSARRAAAGQSSGNLIGDVIPDEHPAAVAAFLDHWKPDCLVWTWGSLHPNLIFDTADANVPMLLADVDADGFDGRRDRWVPDVSRSVLSRFTHVMARSAAGKKRLINLGLPDGKIELADPLTAGGQALPCDEQDLADMSAALVGRSVWFAASVEASELKTVLSAHRHALRLSHRLLLVLLPADTSDPAALQQIIRDEGLRLSCWPDEGEPDESTQVVLSCDPADRGLFFRLAPVSFLGSSLTNTGDACDPLDAAALGSAILYGPKVGRHLPTYSRLASAGAARIVNDAAALGTAVGRLVMPDQAASMAHAGWEVTTNGAATTDRMIDLIQDMLDTSPGAGR